MIQIAWIQTLFKANGISKRSKSRNWKIHT